MSFRRRFYMVRHAAHITRVVAVMWTSVTVFAGSAFAQARPIDVTSELDVLKAENAVVRELLRKMEEQQKALLEQVDRLQRRLDDVANAVVQPNGPPAANAGFESAPPPAPETQDKEDRYQDGIVIWQNSENA